MNRSSFMDRARIEWAVLRVDFDLDGRVPWRRRRQIRAELRSNLSEAAQAVGAKAAVRQLGDLHALAMSYLELYRGRWDFRAGSVAAVATYVALQVLAFVVFMAFSSGVVAGGGHGASYSFWSGFGPFGGSVLSGDRFEVLILSPAHVLLMAAAGLVGSRYRRLLQALGIRPLTGQARLWPW